MAIFTAIGVAIAGALFGGSALAATLIGGALAYGAQLAISYLTRPKKRKYTAVQGETQFGGDVPVGTIYGTSKVRGHRLGYFKYGSGNKFNAEVFVLANGWCDGLEPEVYFYGKKYALIERAVTGNEVKHYETAEFGNNLSFRFYDGRPGQTAASKLVADTANLGQKWKATSACTGLTYVVVEREWDDRFDKGRPDFDFVLRGLREYDPRKDSTVAGGSGPHRLNDPATWEHTLNPALHRLNYQLGLRGLISGRTLIGEGKSMGQLDLGSYIAAMNVCDTLRTDGKKRYQCSLYVSAEDDHTEILKEFDDAMAGYGLNRRGLSGVIPGAPQIPVLEITADDIPVERAQEVQRRKSAFDLYNHLSGQFTSKESQWQPESLKPIYVNADVAADGRARQTSNDFLQVTDPVLAQYLLTIRYRQNRKAGSATIPVSRRVGLAVQEGEWVTFDGLEWLVTGWQCDEQFRFTLTLSETGADIYDDAAIDPGPIVIPPTDPVNPSLLSTVAGFDAQVGMINGGQDFETPALKFIWTPPGDPSITAVRFFYMIDGEPTVYSDQSTEPERGEYTTTKDIQSGKVYVARATITTRPDRLKTYTPWVTTANPTGFLKAILDAAITELKLADRAVSALKIKLATIVAEVIAPAAIEADKIASNAVTELKIAATAVSTAKIQVEAITNSLLGPNAVTATKIIDGAVGESKIAALAISTAKLQLLAVTASILAANSVTTVKIADDSITSPKIVAGAITAGKIAAGSIVAADIAAGTITGDRIAANTITTTQLLVTDLTNLVNESTFESGALGNGWTTPDTAHVSIITTSISSYGPKALRFLTGATANYTQAKSLQVSPGTPLLLKFAGSKSGGTPDVNLRCFIRFADRDNTSLGTGGADLELNAATSGEQNLVATGVAPANTVSATVVILPVSTQGGTGDWRAHFVGVYRRANAELIVDGAITTDKLLANAVTASKIAALTITASQIAAGTITGSKIAAGTITGSLIQGATITGDKLVVNSITAREMILTDYTNLAIEPYFENAGVTWTLNAGATILDDSAIAPPGQRYSLTITGAAGIKASNQNFASVTPGANLTLVAMASRAGSGADLQARVRFTNEVGTFVGTSSITFSGSQTANTWIRQTAAVVVPAGAAKAQVDWSLPAATASFWRAGYASLFRAANGELIVDGAITALKVEAGAITGVKIAAGAITSDKIVAGAITALKIAAGTITADRLILNGITTDRIQPNAVISFEYEETAGYGSGSTIVVADTGSGSTYRILCQIDIVNDSGSPIFLSFFRLVSASNTGSEGGDKYVFGEIRCRRTSDNFIFASDTPKNVQDMTVNNSFTTSNDTAPLSFQDLTAPTGAYSYVIECSADAHNTTGQVRARAQISAIWWKR